MTCWCGSESHILCMTLKKESYVILTAPKKTEETREEWALRKLQEALDLLSARGFEREAKALMRRA